MEEKSQQDEQRTAMKEFINDQQPLQVKE